MVHPVPRFHGFNLDRCALVWWLLDPARCARSIDRDAERYRARSVTAEDHVADRHGVATVDPLPLLCGRDGCRTRDGDTWRWRDRAHVSVDVAPVLTAPLRAAVSRA